MLNFNKTSRERIGTSSVFLSSRSFKRLGLIFLIVFLFLIFPSAQATTIVKGPPVENPALAAEVSLEIAQSGKITTDGRNLQWAEINLTIPQDDVYQDVLGIEEYGDIVSDELENQILKIRQDSPSTTITYANEAQVTVAQRQVFDLPSTYTIPPDVQKFLLPTEHIQSNASVIINQAQQITANSANDFEKVAQLAIWVHDSLTYDISLAGQAKDALWVLDNKIGVCAEYSTLFAALARAAGIPTRYTSLYAYGENGWESHAIVEVYLGKWIMIDPLWLQVGHVDATHVKYTVQEDNQVLNSVIIYGRDVENINWQEDSYEFTTRNVKYNDEILPAEFLSSSRELAPGEDFIVWGKFAVPDYRVESFVLQPCAVADGPPPVVLDDKTARVIFSPQKEKIALWTGQVNPQLSGEYVWTCPLTLNSRFFSTQTINLTIARRHDDSLSLDARLAKSTLSLGEKQIVYVDVERKKGQGDVDVGVLSGDHVETKMLHSALSERSFTFEFAPESLGTNQIVIFSSAGDLEGLSFLVEQAGDVFIKRIELPVNATVGQNVTANITIANKRPTAQTLKLQINGQIQTIIVEDEKTIGWPVNTSAVGKQSLSVKIFDTDIADEEYREIMVYGPAGEIEEAEENIFVKILNAIVGFFQNLWTMIT